MPNNDLNGLLPDRVDRYRLTQVQRDGQTVYTHEVVAGLRARVRLQTGDPRRREQGTEIPGDYGVTLDPDSDVRAPDPAALPPVRDVLVVTLGQFEGHVLEVGSVRCGHLIGFRKADCSRLPVLPPAAS